MPRCLMAKKWKVYPWSTTNPSAAGTATVLGVPDTSAAAIALNGVHHRLHEKLVVSVADDDEDDRSMKKSIICHENETNNNNNDDDDEEEIDVVTIQQNATDTKPIIHYQQQQHQQQQHSRHDEEATASRTTSPIPPTMASNGCNNQTVIEHTPLPPQNYYQTSAEDYPPLGENQHVVLDGKLVQSSVQSGQLLPSVIQQHTSHPTPQIRLTSVIQHGASFIQTSSSSPSSSMQQPPPGQAGMHHSASPMQPQSAWGPSSPTEGATAPSPPPHIQHSSDSDVTTIHYNGYSTASDINHYTAFLPSDGSTGSSRSYATLQSPNESRAAAAAAVAAAAAAAAAALAATNTASGPPVSPVSPSGSSSPTSSVGSTSSSSNGGGCGSPRTRSLAMCFTSTGAALSLPPKKKDIYRPYSLDDRPSVRWRPPEDLTAAHAILDLSASPPAPAPSQSLQNVSTSQQPPHSGASAAVKTVIPTKPAQTKTIAYTYEAFFVSDGRSKKKSLPVENTSLPGGAVAVAGAIAAQTVGTDQRPKYTCSECGKQYATSSNLSRHKQTHRSLDSQSAKKCVTCGKAYVSMPALAMHLLTHKLNHACGICGKLFSRPWLLQGHLRSHTGEKPYGCAHCGKAFADRSNLRAHMQTHSTDKNFECTRCHKTFALKSYLNKHLESACVGDTNECSNTAISTNQVPTITHLR